MRISRTGKCSFAKVRLKADPTYECPAYEYHLVRGIRLQPDFDGPSAYGFASTLAAMIMRCASDVPW